MKPSFVDKEPQYRFPSTRRVVVATTLAVAAVAAACTGGSPRSGETTETITVDSGPEVAMQEDVLWQWDGDDSLDAWNVATESEPIYNDEEQTYTDNPENVRVDNGALVLEAHRTPEGITSGKVTTKGLFAVAVGSRIEARIRMPEGKGTWPAFWLLSDNQPHTAALSPTDADWAQERFYMHDGEIDIMEYYGSNPDDVEATVHTYTASTESYVSVPDADETFHAYGLEWHADKLVWTLDGEPYHTFNKPSDSSDDWPFGEGNEMYLILNLAMGGSGGGEIEDQPDDTWRMEIASVTVSELTD